MQASNPDLSFPKGGSTQIWDFGSRSARESGVDSENILQSAMLPVLPPVLGLLLLFLYKK